MNIIRNYADAQFTLFYKENILPLNEGYNISIVLSRKYSNYGKDVLKLYANNINTIIEW